MVNSKELWFFEITVFLMHFHCNFTAHICSVPLTHSILQNQGETAVLPVLPPMASLLWYALQPMGITMLQPINWSSILQKEIIIWRKVKMYILMYLRNIWRHKSWLYKGKAEKVWHNELNKINYKLEVLLFEHFVAVF